MNNILLLHFWNVVVLIITMHFDNVPIWADQEMYLLKKILKAEFTFSCRNYSLYNRLASHKTNRRVNTQLEIIPREQSHHVRQFSKEELL